MYLILDMARGIAALSVFLYHIQGALVIPTPAMAKIAQFGNLGVTLFFVISGYVITASAEAVLLKNQSSNSFLKRRFLRIYPPFWVSILVVVSIPYLIAAVSSLKSGIYHLPELRFLTLSGMEWLQLITLTKIFMSESTNLQAQFNQVNSVYWTLAIEFQFYLCVYVALVFRKYFYFVISTITIVSLLFLLYPQHLNTGLFIHFWPMFALGIILYYGMRKGLTLEKLFVKNSRVIAAIAVVMLTGAIIIVAYRGELSKLLGSGISPSSFGFALICSCVLWFAAPLETVLENAKNSKNLMSRCLIKTSAFLGVISYSLYLLHGKIAELPAMVARQVISMDSALYPLLTVSGTIALCSVFYFYIEKPFMSKNQKEIYHTSLATTPTSSDTSLRVAQ